MMKPSFKFSSIQSSNDRIEASQFSMVVFEREGECANWGGANTRKMLV